MQSIWEQINHSAADVVAQVGRSVVQLVSDEGSVGAGTVWHAKGIILTNAHVAVGRRSPRRLEAILADNRRVVASLVAYDEKHDLAALEIHADNLAPIRIGDSSLVKPGDYMMALGHPWGMVDALTAGVVIGQGENLPEMEGREWIALDMKMRPGHSGGALFNTSGELMGVNTLIRGPEVSFAVPVNRARAFMKDVLKADERDRAFI
jgi:S1-C subfamily serine protease